MAETNMAVLAVGLTVLAMPRTGFDGRKKLTALALTCYGELRLAVGQQPPELVVAVMMLAGGLLLLAEMSAPSRLVNALWVAGGGLLAVLYGQREAVHGWLLPARPWVAVAAAVGLVTLWVRASRAQALARDPSEGMRGV
ncbi:hypothetical protein [Streptomyces triticirhizae]|uniref:Uncharacterized protein n=1 Tax=Streptomyces triticirhizae TaxID=2483353 RepID=A0A3M2M3Z3_9ACTN|nr:hypothetical protein [Streptomyces triticirhizae]RMI44152.1 hypothetical protein EBN88_06020 [Streptomyces triticirhizae]